MVKNQCQQKEVIYISFEKYFDTDHFLLKDLGVWTLLLQLCVVKVTDDVIAEKIVYFQSKL